MSLVEAKQILTVKSSDASTESDSDSIPLVLAPPIKLSDITAFIDQIQSHLQENYKFETRLSGQRLKLGFRIVKEGFFCVEWAVFNEAENGKKNVFAVYKQALLTNYSTDANTGKVSIALKTIDFDVVEDILNNLREKLITVTDFSSLQPIAPPPSSFTLVEEDKKDEVKEPKPKTAEEIAAELAEQKKAEEAAKLAAEKAAQEAKKKAEEELAARSPLSYRHLPDVDNTDFVTSGEFYWGGLSSEDFNSIAVDEVQKKQSAGTLNQEQDNKPVSVVVPPAPAPPTREELNARGKVEFRGSNLHVNTFYLAHAVQTVLRPFVSMILPPVAGSSQLRIVNEPTVYAVNDLQVVFENDFAKVLEEKRKLTVMFTPIVNLSGKAKSQTLTLYSGDAENYVLAPVSSVETFAIVFQLEGPEYKVTKFQFSGIQNDARTKKFLECSVSRIREYLAANNLIAETKPEAAAAPKKSAGPDIKGTFDQHSVASQKSRAGRKAGDLF